MTRPLASCVRTGCAASGEGPPDASAFCARTVVVPSSPVRASAAAIENANVGRLATRTTHCSADSWLERESNAELHLAGVLGAGDAAEVRIAEDAVWKVEVRAIEEVEDLPAELQLGAASRPPR